MKLKDLYSLQEAESQPVNVDGEEDEAKDNDNETEAQDVEMTAVEASAQPAESTTTKPAETGQRQIKKHLSMESEPAASGSAVKVEEDLSVLLMKPRSRRENLTMLPKPSQLEENQNPYSDISDASDADMELSEEKSVAPRVTPSTLLPSQQNLLNMNGMYYGGPQDQGNGKVVMKEQKRSTHDGHMQPLKPPQPGSLPAFSEIGDMMTTKPQQSSKRGRKVLSPPPNPQVQRSPLLQYSGQHS